MVNTFVVSANPADVELLNNKHLNRQREEAILILDTIVNPTTAAKSRLNNPVVLMWRDHPDALRVYINHCIRAWRARGGNCKAEEFDVDETTVEWPWWHSWELFHLAHKCSLVRKKPEYYGPIFNLTDDERAWLDYGYIWPHTLNDDVRREVEDGVVHLPSEVCSPIGKGAPAEYRWSREDVMVWLADPTRNPRTGRAIKADSKGGVAAELREAAVAYSLMTDTKKAGKSPTWTLEEVTAWRSDPTHNPRTGRPIKTDSKGGITAELKKAAVYYDSL